VSFDLDTAVKIFTLLLAGAAAAISWLSYRRSAAHKIAEFRMRWIDAYREDLANLTKLRSAVIVLRRRIAGDTETPERKEWQRRARELEIEAVGLRSRLLLRLKPESDDPDEQALERLFRNAMDKDPDRADEDRKLIMRHSRSLLKREWDRVKAEIEKSRTT
jgi:hypothetical protein